jgi:hypothetical protein
MRIDLCSEKPLLSFLHLADRPAHDFPLKGSFSFSNLFISTPPSVSNYLILIGAVPVLMVKMLLIVNPY